MFKEIPPYNQDFIGRKLHLLLYDADVGDYSYWACFDDTEEAWSAIAKIVANRVGYRVIRGDVIVEVTEVDYVGYEDYDTWLHDKKQEVLHNYEYSTYYC